MIPFITLYVIAPYNADNMQRKPDLPTAKHVGNIRQGHLCDLFLLLQ